MGGPDKMQQLESEICDHSRVASYIASEEMMGTKTGHLL